MKNKKNNYPGIHIGSASMLVIFIILCLVTFSVLSVASANRDFSYSKKVATKTKEYYLACNQAEKLLDKIDTILSDSYSIYENRFLEKLPEKLNTMKELDISAFPVISYEIPINKTQALHVSLSLQTPKDENDTLYTIISWNKFSTDQWDEKTTLNLM